MLRCIIPHLGRKSKFLSAGMRVLAAKRHKRDFHHEETKGHEVKGGFLIDKLRFSSYCFGVDCFFRADGQVVWGSIVPV